MGRSRSRSPKRRERRRSRSLSPRDRDRDLDKRRRFTERRRSHSRSRSPVRRFRRSRSRSRSPRRRRSRTPSPRRRRRSETPEKPGPSGGKQEAEMPEIDEKQLEDMTEDEIEMMKVMGFAAFDTTKGKRVDGANNAFAANIQTKRKYRQYMNRRGGFNRPLDFIA
ncbi:U4/U6.U5 small nuclear ribonucleoprotein 27 kDa protein [Strongylocentrotus purpuratus]|uniref:U4/U6.U5 small nuclear ribonucleoprotein 27 kDa protein n=1 Tax=Strongylocentrotus purpuratus TaxID=7668 RepID=A0A7M7RHW7_STRPU|nr:U4/U6.U5 small nuclear ribonucleoprotein 27 kDa protein [Strongylocentrotus purpuratus]|eukprot:XP_792162.1 PREDICTED: U4/U6.U5 small nuclear ribonucleoprotein 27 kDa protein [Strongylocentrotus purpuratus]